MTQKANNQSLQIQISRLEAQLESLLAEEEVMWDEVNAVERDLKALRIALEQVSYSPYAAEDAAVAMMESAAKRSIYNH